MAWELSAELSLWIATMARVLHGRSAWRLEALFVGILFGQGRRTVTSWLRAAGLQADFRQHYYFLGSLGRKTSWVAAQLLLRIVAQISLGVRLLMALDDSPTKRQGPLVEGAGIHHNPTPGPAGQNFLYGHVWVTLALVVRHRRWGAIALPLLASLYIRALDVAKLPPWYHWKFETKLEMAATMVEWAADVLQRCGKTLWLVADGAYAKRPFLSRVMAAGVVVVSRLRKDAALHDLPAEARPGQKRRGRPRKYGPNRIDLAKRAAHRLGWLTGDFQLYGKLMTKTYKTFLATYAPAGGVIRVVLVKESDHWVAFFCTDPQASVSDILEAVADRASLEQVFHDVKEIYGAGQQQLRNVWANVAAFNMNLWMYTLVELWAWDRSHEELCDRSASPWDNATRRPSHADRRKALRREMMQEHFSSLPMPRPLRRKIQALLEHTLALAG